MTHDIVHAWIETISLQTLLFAAGSMLLGILFGALPGLTAALGVALLTGLTFSLSTEHMLVILICIYVGAIYGGSISAILTNIPGTGAAMATAWEGYPLAQRGEAGLAIGTAATASLIGTLIGLTALAVATPLLERVALKIGSPEIALLALLGMLMVGALNDSGSVLKGWTAGLVGLLISTIGLDAITALPRFTGGSAQLIGGIPFIPAMIGLFGIVQVVGSLSLGQLSPIVSVPRVLPNVRLMVKHLALIIRSGLIGVGTGVTPGVGENIASLLSYIAAKKTSRASKTYGKGSYEGLIAAETANNACVPASMIPLITLGIPGSPVTAILLGALLLHGVQPGPMLLVEHPDMLGKLIAIFALAAVLLFTLALLLARPISQVLRIKPAILLPAVTALCVIGAFSLSLSHFDIGVMAAFGLLGLLMRLGGYPPAPVVMGLILGPYLETNLRRTFMLSDGSPAPFFSSPIALVLSITVGLVILYQLGLGREARRYGRFAMIMSSAEWCSQNTQDKKISDMKMVKALKFPPWARLGPGLCLVGVMALAPLTGAQDASGRIRPYAGNPYYWEYKSEPVMLLGGSWQDNLFNHPIGLEGHLDRLVEVGGNYIRNTMSSRNQGNVWAFAEVGTGIYDLDTWNEEYWDRLTHLLELTRARDIIVQVEFWDPHDHFRDHQTQGGWSFHPFNPENNVTYTAEQSNLPTVVDYPPRATPGNHGFFRTVPDLDNNTLVLDYQQRYVDRLLSITLGYPHVIYCMNNETGEDPEWGDYWLRYVRKRARQAGVEIHTTDMRRRNDITADDHAFIYRNPDRYTFVDISQNNSQVISPGQLHWDRIMAVRSMLDKLGPRPINNVKVYSREDGEHIDGPQRFWRIIFGGCASVRFHRPHPFEGGPEHHYVRSHGGLGLHHQAQLNIRSARMLTQAMDIFSAGPRNDLLTEREENEAYCLAVPGEAYAVYFPQGGAVVLEAAAAGRGYDARWLRIDENRWLEPVVVEGTGAVALEPPGEEPWLVVLTRRDDEKKRSGLR